MSIAPAIDRDAIERIVREIVYKQSTAKPQAAELVVSVSAQVGQQIQANDVLVVLEAMKMETVVTSPVNGKIAKVNVSAGDSVQGGQLLIEFE